MSDSSLLRVQRLVEMCCCSVLQCAAVRAAALVIARNKTFKYLCVLCAYHFGHTQIRVLLQCVVAVCCCSVLLQCVVAVCCSVLQCEPLHSKLNTTFQYLCVLYANHFGHTQRVLLQRVVAVCCCSVFQFVVAA